MDFLTIKSEIDSLLHKANSDINLSNDQIDMFTPICGVAPRDLLFVSMELKKKYEIDFNQLLDSITVFSLHNFASAICSQLNLEKMD